MPLGASRNNYNDYLRPNDVHHMYSLGLFEDALLNCFISLQFEHSCSSLLDKEKLARLEFILPHARRAYLMNRRLAQSSGRSKALSSIFERTHHGLFFLDGRGRVLESNSSGDMILHENDGIFVGKDKMLSAERSEDSARLRKTVFGCVTGCVISGEELVRVSRPSGKRDYLVFASRLPEKESVCFQNYPCCLVWISDPERISSIEPKVISEAFELTPGESKICSLLVQGYRIDAIASLLKVSKDAVRFHLKNIFLKTDTSSQAELISLLLRSFDHLSKDINEF